MTLLLHQMLLILISQLQSSRQVILHMLLLLNSLSQTVKLQRQSVDLKIIFLCQAQDLIEPFPPLPQSSEQRCPRPLSPWRALHQGHQKVGQSSSSYSQ